MYVIPLPLTEGDSVAIVAPAGNIQDLSRYHVGCSILEGMGFEIFQKVEKWPGTGFLSNDDESRAREFMSAWGNPEVKAIFALRGGYGSLRILDMLDLEVIRSNPKLFVGFSDITILLNHISQQTNQICLHGPVISSLVNIDNSSIERLYHCLAGNWLGRLWENIEIIRPAPTVTGPLMGGNLSSLITLLGTKWDVKYHDTILFLEDINEPLYRLDRLLTQFSLSGKFEGVKGIILGDFSKDSEAKKNDRDRTQEFVWNRIAELVPDPAIPLWGNFPAGHSRRNIALPIGANCSMDSSRGSLSFKPQ